jgi:type IV pilus assembly protein PilN
MIRINLLGHESAKPKRRSASERSVGGSDSAPFILAVVATVVIVAAAWFWQSRAAASADLRYTAVSAEQQELADTSARLQLLEDRRAAVDQRLGVIVALKKSQSGPVLLLDQISRELSDSLWLTDLTLTEGDVSITGQALSENFISDFAQNLRLSQYFSDTTLVSTRDTGTSVRFQLSTRFIPLTVLEEAAGGAGEGAAPAGR